MPEPNSSYEPDKDELEDENDIHPLVTPDVTGTPISLVPLREDPTASEPEDPEEPDDPSTPLQLRDDHSKFVFRVQQGGKFQVTITLNRKVVPNPVLGITKENAAIQLSFRDCTGGFLKKDDGITPAMPPVLVRYNKNNPTPKILVSTLITADASLGDVVIVAQRAIVTNDTVTPPIYAVVGDKRHCRVGSLKIVIPLFASQNPQVPQLGT